MSMYIENRWPTCIYIVIFILGDSQFTTSTIYKWNMKTKRFLSFQNISTIGAYDWTYFSAEGYHFLALAQAFDGKTTLIDSRIYVFQNDEFLLFQTMEVLGQNLFLYGCLQMYWSTSAIAFRNKGPNCIKTLIWLNILHSKIPYSKCHT